VLKLCQWVRPHSRQIRDLAAFARQGTGVAGNLTTHTGDLTVGCVLLGSSHEVPLSGLAIKALSESPDSDGSAVPLRKQQIGIRGLNAALAGMVKKQIRTLQHMRRPASRKEAPSVPDYAIITEVIEL
jgi:hypothetical protein